MQIRVFTRVDRNRSSPSKCFTLGILGFTFVFSFEFYSESLRIFVHQENELYK